MRRPAPAWVVPAMRAGYLARATVFGLVGFLVIRAAWHGGYPGGPEEALVSLADQGFGGSSSGALRPVQSGSPSGA